MNFQAWNLRRLALIFGFGRGAQVGETSLFQVNLYGAIVDVGGIIFYLVRFRFLELTPKTLDLGRRRSIF